KLLIPCLVSGEYRRVAFPEEIRVQQSYGPVNFLVIYDKSQIYDRGALADHVNVDIAKGAKQPGSDPWSELEVVAHSADNGLGRVDIGLAKLAELFQYRLEAVSTIKGHRNGSLGCGNDVDRGLVTVEHFEYCS